MQELFHPLRYADNKHFHNDSMWGLLVESEESEPSLAQPRHRNVIRSDQTRVVWCFKHHFWVPIRLLHPQLNRVHKLLDIHIKRQAPSMNASRSLFATAFKDTAHTRPAFGIKKSIPFLNYWVPSSQSQAQTPPTTQQKRYQANMSSATSFYDFKPLDSKLTLYLSFNPITPQFPRAFVKK